jgi:hypothetical protein
VVHLSFPLELRLNSIVRTVDFPDLYRAIPRGRGNKLGVLLVVLDIRKSNLCDRVFWPIFSVAVVSVSCLVVAPLRLAISASTSEHVYNYLNERNISLIIMGCSIK